MTIESVTKRNDPCPCGSGKKFKKCCMLKPENGLSHLLNQEFDRVNQSFYSFSRKNFSGKLDRYINTLCLDYAIPYTQRKVVKDFSYIWSLFHLPVQGESATFDLYLDDYQKEAKRETAIRMLSNWKEAHFSIYRISEITDALHMVLHDIWSDKTYTVPVLAGHQPPDLKNLIMGMIVPIHEDTHDFVLGYAQIENMPFTEKKLEVIQDTYLSDPELSIEDQLDRSLPFILIELLSNESTQVAKEDLTQGNEDINSQKTDNPIDPILSVTSNSRDLTSFNGSDNQHKALDLFINQKDSSIVTPDAIKEAVQLWQTFVEAKDPSIKKPEAYAAALDYWASNRTSYGEVTQSTISKKYGVSSATVSKNFRLLEEFFTHQVSQGTHSNEKELVGATQS